MVSKAEAFLRLMGDMDRFLGGKAGSVFPQSLADEDELFEDELDFCAAAGMDHPNYNDFINKYSK